MTDTPETAPEVTQALDTCPFCGSAKVAFDIMSRDSDGEPVDYSPECASCGATIIGKSDEKLSKERATSLWNRRHRTTPEAARQDVRENDKPPFHWVPNDRYADRMPMTPEEWDWRADGPDNDALGRSIKRLDYAADIADPAAPDQMAIVLRIDLMRLTSQVTWLTAKTEMYGKILAERNELRAALASPDDGEGK